MADEGALDAEEAESAAEEPAKPKKKKKPRPCERCGTFAKRRMILGQKLCADCVGKGLHAAAEGPITTGDLLSGALSLTGVVAVPAMIAALVPQVLQSALALAGVAGPQELQAVNVGLSVVAGPVVTSFIVVLAWRAIRNEALDVGSALGLAMSAWFPVFVTGLVSGLSVGLYSLLLIIPGILRFLDIFLAQTVTVLEGRGAVESMDESIARCRPFRGALFGALFAGGAFGGMILIVLAVFAESVPWAVLVVSPVVLAALQVVFGCLAVVLYTRERLIRKA